MKYRYANRTEVNEQARKEEALDSDVQAFAAWIEALIAGIDDPDESTKSQRAYADKRLVEEECSKADVRSRRQNFLEGWLRRLEEQHATMEAKAEIKEEQDEDSSLFRREMQRLEKAHSVAAEQLDALLNETPRAERRARAKATKKTTTKAAGARKRTVSS